VVQYSTRAQRIAKAYTILSKDRLSKLVSKDLVHMDTSFKKKIENRISEFQKIEKNIHMYPTIYPTNLQKTLYKYFVFWATQKWQTSRSEYVRFKSANFIRFLLFLRSPQYKEFHNEILHNCR
jgi:hypothetical protein